MRDGTPRLTAALLLLALACGEADRVGVEDPGGTMAGETDRWAGARHLMVEDQIEARGVRDPKVLRAMRTVPRHEFVPEDWRAAAYQDRALPIGHGQTISQPYIVAVMTELARAREGSRVLEIGTGSGYQAAVLAEVGAEVWSIEVVGPLAREAEALLRRLGYDRVHVRHGDGWGGWPDAAPFDAVIVTAAPETVPPALIAQLRVGGRLVIPVGPAYDQRLEVHERTADGVRVEPVFGVRFVPFVHDDS